ncbi:MAG: prolipoprotein diacylglyceryl transferase [Flammeovirgaceae bacterium]|nr:prolipoprotein diacylglyceryl transferase [Flammeovirgaceae bacterium]
MNPIETLSFITWNVDPRIFPGFELFLWYGLLWAVGTLLGYQVMFFIYKKEGLLPSELDKLATYLILGAILGARFGHILFYDPIYYWNNPIEILPIQIQPHFQFKGLEGLASYGGVLGTLIALYLYHKKYKGNFLWILDRLAISAALLGGFIRLGNLMNSEIIGIPTFVQWAFVFTRIDHTPRHPTQLYEAIFYFFISIFLFHLWKLGRVKNYSGFIFGLGASLIFTLRFLIEFLKENQVSFEESLLLNMDQTLSIPMILIGIFILARSIIQPFKIREENV